MLKIPKGEHWAIITERTITIPGDLRSQQAPGHGYPEHTEAVIGYEAFTDSAKFEAELQRRFSVSYQRDQTRGIHVTETFAHRVIVSVEVEAEPPRERTDGEA